MSTLFYYRPDMNNWEKKQHYSHYMYYYSMFNASSEFPNKCACTLRGHSLITH